MKGARSHQAAGGQGRITTGSTTSIVKKKKHRIKGWDTAAAWMDDRAACTAGADSLLSHHDDVGFQLGLKLEVRSCQTL